MKRIFCCLCLLVSLTLKAQQGILSGSVLDEKSNALEGASVQLQPFTDSTKKVTIATDKNGLFFFDDLPFDFYRLHVSYVGLVSVTIDSIHIRSERSDFFLGDLILKQATAGKMQEIIVYAEKPLIQSKDGNITFNAGESALSQGSNASDLLANAPLVTKDPNGKILVRGKEPKILIDDKPVNLNVQQMQDLLESLPGSSIEKIEVLTNPPPQYANEEGGVINIITRKGSVGMGGRLTTYTGTRGEIGGNGNFNYRKQGLALNINAGAAKNNFTGNGYSIRENIFADSSSHLNTNNNYTNKNVRPNARLNFDYEINKFQSISLTLQYNSNDYDNGNNTEYRHLNRLDQLYKFSKRRIASNGNNNNETINFGYILKTKNPGESFKLHANASRSNSLQDRLFYQQFFTPEMIFTGQDSTQTQLSTNGTNSYQLQLTYDRPLSNKKTSFAFGSTLNGTRSNMETNAAYKRKSDGKMTPMDLLSNRFVFKQNINSLRLSVKQSLSPKSSLTAGVAADQTNINFDFHTNNPDTTNSYWTPLPFVTFNSGWKDIWNVNVKYRRTIRRPGINELNPTIDFSDAYNTRFGNPQLEASTVHNFDVVLGRNKSLFYANMGLGYNIVQNIFSQVRTLNPDGKTEITWQNISGRKEWEVSTWSGYSINKKLRFNLSASYTYNQYSDYDREIRKFRNGGSLTSNINSNYSIKDLYIFTGNFTLNRFANPQGSVRSTASMNLGVQGKFLNKKVIISFNAIDPFIQQENKTVAFGTNFILNNYSSTNTRNYKLTLSYNFIKTMNLKSKSAINKRNNTKLQTKKQ